MIYTENKRNNKWNISSSNNLQKRFNKRISLTGFTLIEFLVVISITILIATMALTHYREAERELNIYSDAEKIVSILKSAQADALSGSLVGSIRPSHFGIIWKYGEHDYTFFAENDDNCAYSGPDGDNFLIQNFDLTEGVVIQNSPSPVIFDVPKAEVYKGNGGCSSLTGGDYVRITLFQEASGRTVHVDVYGQGKIEIIKE